jgi:hypothetical protein
MGKNHRGNALSWRLTKNVTSAIIFGESYPENIYCGKAKRKK